MPGDDAGADEGPASGDADGQTDGDGGDGGGTTAAGDDVTIPAADGADGGDAGRSESADRVDFGALRPAVRLAVDRNPVLREGADYEPAAVRVADRNPVLDTDFPQAVERVVGEGGATAGEYTWIDYLREYGHSKAAHRVEQRRERVRHELAVADLDPLDPGDYGDDEDPPTRDERVEPPYPDFDERDADPPRPNWDRLDADPTDDLGFKPEARDTVLGAAARRASNFHDFFDEFTDPETTPVVKDEWLWEHYKREYYYVGENNWTRPRDEDGEIVRFDPVDALGFDPEAIETWLSVKGTAGERTRDLVDERTVDVRGDVDEDAFFSTVEGRTTMANRYDLEKAVPMEKKLHFREVERYWVNKPYAFVIIFHSDRENEKKYYLVEPYRNPIERDLQEFLTGKLRTAIKYASDDVAAAGDEASRRSVIERETRDLLDRYDLYDGPAADTRSVLDRVLVALGQRDPPEEPDDDRIDGIMARPEPAVLAEDPETLTQYQVETLLYTLQRNFIGYERIDGVKHDINVEDISCDGYDSPVFVYHTDYENLITNVTHGRESLDDFVVKLAQRSGKGISKRQPQVDATLPDGSRAQLTLGREVSDHGTNYTIRQFKDVPFTPVDLVNWQTFSLDEMAFLWLCIESEKSIVFAGGTASGKTTSLNAVSLFIPSNSKIVSIEDTREVELPQRNWIASVTRPSFGEDETGDIDEFDLLEAALRQRPDYIVMGEVRGEEGRTLFQVMSTGHTTYTTFHADNVGEVLKRFTTEPINVSKTLFTALDLVSVQSQTRVRGRKVRRNRSITEINRYDPENDEINVNDVFQWEPEDDAYRQTADSSTLEEIKFDRGWTDRELDRELQERRVLLAYLIREGLNEYAQVAATAQAYINDPETILTLVANDDLEAALEDLRGMESVLIDVDPEKEEMVPRPDPSEDGLAEADGILEAARGEDGVLAEYEGESVDSLALALAPDAADRDVVAEPRDLDAMDLEAAIERVTGESLPERASTDTERGDGLHAADPLPDDLEPAVEPVDDVDDDGFGSFEPAKPVEEADAAEESDSAADGGEPQDEGSQPQDEDGQTPDDGDQPQDEGSQPQDEDGQAPSGGSDSGDAGEARGGGTE
ncbi:ATPase, T2SS/T4P/T4SS family [Halobacterium yunchengense]|uniref:ATPase, T2SS/T4P/T4SS family n=1 Tax=Halobacterium yunchengense TaxID=3108497 RepID=UPI003AB3A4B5